MAVISSALGWLVNGPVIDESRQSSVNTVNSHIMKIESQRTEEKLLSDQINKFWNLDTVEIVFQDQLKCGVIEKVDDPGFQEKPHTYHTEK